jgi:hypothetical protein
VVEGALYLRLAVLGNFNRAAFQWGRNYLRSVITEAASGAKLPRYVLADSFSVDAPLLCAVGSKQTDSREFAPGDRFSSGFAS